MTGANGNAPIEDTRRGKPSTVVAISPALVSPTDAAAILGVGRSYFSEHFETRLRCYRRGKVRLYLVSDLHSFAEKLIEEHGSVLPQVQA